MAHHPSTKNTQPLAIALGLYGVATLVSMAAMSLAAGLVLAVLFCTRGANWRRFLKSRLAWAGLALAFAAGISLLVAQGLPLDYGASHVPVPWTRALGKLVYLAWPLILAAALLQVSSTQRTQAMDAWGYAAVVLAFIGCIQYFTGWPRPQNIPTVPGRFHATLFLGHHLSVASIFIFPWFWWLERTWDSRGTQKALAGACAALLALLLFFTYSRMVWLAAPFGLGVFVLWKIRSKRLRWIAPAVIAVAVLGLAQVPAIHARMNWSYGVWQREMLWEANEEFIRQRPVTGVGMLRNDGLSGTYLIERLHRPDVFAGHAHDNVLEILAGMGILGLLAWLWWWSEALRIFWAAPGRAGWICAILVYQLNGLTQVNWWEGKVLHSLGWALGCALASARTLGAEKSRA